MRKKPEEVGYQGETFTSEEFNIGDIVPAFGPSYLANMVEITGKENNPVFGSWKYKYAYRVVE